MKPDVLIFTSIYDFSSDMVALELEKRGARYFRLNKEQLSDFSISLDIQTQVLQIRSHEIDINMDSSLQAVYFKQPVFLRNTPNNALSVDQQLSRSQWSAFGRALSVFDQAKWINWPQATYLAECKPYQLSLAKRLGFRTPSTKVTNNTKMLPTSTNDELVIKSLDTALFREGSDCLFTYTTKVSNEELTNSDSSAAPMIIQENVSPKCDIRVTVIGTDVYAVKILASGKCIEGDWRTTDRNELEYVDFELPVDIRGLCIDLVRSLGLVFGAIDLLENSGFYTFLEINPTGEWAWLQSQNRNLSSSIASALIK